MRSFLIALMLMIPALCMQAQEFNYDEIHSSVKLGALLKA